MITRQIPPAFAGMIAALTLAAPLHAGVINEVVVSKDRFYKQTNATTVSLIPADFYPFAFNVGITGPDAAAVVALKPRPTITLPANATFAQKYNVTPALGIDEERNEWKFGYIGQKPFDNWGTKTNAEMDAVLPNGNYLFNVEGKVINLSFSGGVYPTAPLLALSGGNWSNGAYRIKSNQTLTINSGTYLAYGSNLNNYLYLGMENDATGEEIFDHTQVAKKLAFGPPQSSLKSHTRKVLANTLAPGTYYVYAGYGRILSISTALPQALAISAIGTETEVKVVVTAP